METIILLFAISQVVEGLVLGLILYLYFRKKKRKAKDVKDKGPSYS